MEGIEGKGTAHAHLGPATNMRADIAIGTETAGHGGGQQLSSPAMHTSAFKTNNTNNYELPSQIDLDSGTRQLSANFPYHLRPPYPPVVNNGASLEYATPRRGESVSYTQGSSPCT